MGARVRRDGSAHLLSYGGGTELAVSGERIVWVGSDSSDSEIFTWKTGDAEAVNISNNDVPDRAPRVSGDRVAWTSGPTSDPQICTWKTGDTEPTVLSTDSVMGSTPISAVSGDAVVWAAFNSEADLSLINEAWRWFVVARLVDVPPTPVYRFYRPSTGTHFYTADEAEMVRVRDTMGSTYRFEGVAYDVNTVSANNCVPLYRFYNKRAGTHLYTADKAERDSILANQSATYSLDGVAYNVSMTAGIQVHRFYNPGANVHLYSSDPAEIASVRASLGQIWRYEGPAYLIAK